MKTAQMIGTKEKFPKASKNIGNEREGIENIGKCSQKAAAFSQHESPRKQSKNNPDMKTEKRCLHCRQPFQPSRSDAKFCNTMCRWNAWKQRQSTEAKIKVHPAAIRLLTDATWDFAHRILWGGFPFSKAEIELARLLIKEYYEEIPAERFKETAHRHFTAYCERILLARNYVSRFPHRYIPHPCIWLHRENPKGFAGTKAWYLRNLEKRKQTQLCESCGESLNPILNHFHFCA